MTLANKDTPNKLHQQNEYIGNTKATKKHPKSGRKVHQNKKANMDKGAPESTKDINLGNLKSLQVPLMEKVDQLRESVDTKHSKIE